MNTQSTGASVLLIGAPDKALRTLLDALGDGHRVRQVDDVDAALAAAASEQPDAVVLSAKDDQGLQGLERLHADARLRGAALLLLDDPASETYAQAIAHGAVDCLERPLRPTVVVARITAHAELRNCRDALLAHTQIDGLTGIADHARFHAFLPAAYAHCRRVEKPLALILFDADQFSDFNERYGREAGDEALIHIGRTMAAERRRPLDLVARLRGASFACVLPETDLAGAKVVAEQLRSDVDDLGIEHKGSSTGPHLTVSLGIAAIRPEPGQLPLALVDAAGEALKRAKQAGGNRLSD